MNVRRAIPISLTIFRLFLGPAFIWLHNPERPHVYTLLAIVGLALVTDWLDGMLARRWQAVSTAGKLMDPFADALFCMFVFWDFQRYGIIPPWLFWILVAREALVTFVLRPTALTRGIVVAAGMPGKIKTVIQFVVIVLVIVRMWPAFQLGFWTAVLWVGFIGMLGFSVGSAAQYAYDIVRALRRGGKTATPAGEDAQSK